MQEKTPTAKLIIIGNEILSGKIQDKNTQFIAQELNKIGIKLTEVRTIADTEDDIVAAVRDLKVKCDYVFTTGGIGPTHDDITARSIAKAFGRRYCLNEEAKALMERHYKRINTDLTEVRLKMAYTPEGAKLITNEDIAAPGFIIENVYVLAGIPVVMHAMFDELKSTLKGGKEILSRSIDIFIPESVIAEQIGIIQEKYPSIEIGSYPFIRRTQWGTTIMLSSNNPEMMESAMEEIHSYLESI